ncbi:MAG: DUF4340 domain-containing protein [Leptonema sp. (in: bacteria)]
MKFLKLYKNNLGLSLFLTNIILFIVFLVLRDPFSIFSKTYDKAPNLITIDPNRFNKIEIEQKDKKITYELIKKDSKERKFKNLEELIENTEWSFLLKRENKNEEFSVDKENLKNLLNEILNFKKYYYLEKNLENEISTGIKNSNLKIQLFYDQNSKLTITVGLSSIRNNTTYIVLDNEDKIYQIEGNLRTRLGSDEIYYFRNHKIIHLDKPKITKVLVSNKNIVYAKTGNEWQTLQPKPEKLQSSFFEGILDEIVNLKVNTFYGKDLPKDAFEKFQIILEFYIQEENLGETKKEVLEILGKKDYVKYLIQWKDEFYETSLYRIEDLLEPEKLTEKK